MQFKLTIFLINDFAVLEWKVPHGKCFIYFFYNLIL